MASLLFINQEKENVETQSARTINRRFASCYCSSLREVAGFCPLASGWFFQIRNQSAFGNDLYISTSLATEDRGGEEAELQSSHLPRSLGKDTVFPNQPPSHTVPRGLQSSILTLQNPCCHTECRRPSQLGSRPEGTCFPLQEERGLGLHTTVGLRSLSSVDLQQSRPQACLKTSCSTNIWVV